MSGVNRLINSDNTVTGNSFEELANKETGDANERAAEITKNGMKYKEGSENVEK